MSNDNESLEPIGIDQITYYLEINRFEEAKELIFQALNQEPNDGTLLYLLGTACFGLEEYEEAIEYATDALRNGLPAEQGYELLGDIYMEMEEYGEAENLYLEALRFNPENAEVLASYGFILFITGKRKKGQKLLEQARMLEPENETVLHYILYTNFTRGKKAQVDLLEKFVQTSSHEIVTLINIGMSEFMQGNYKAAREQFRQAYLLDPMNKDILELLEEADKNSHFLYLPSRLIFKLGGPYPFWFISLSLLILTNSFINLGVFSDIILISFFVFYLYTLIIGPLLYKIFVKAR